MKETTKKGFTVGELLIVVTIISILVSVSIPLFSSETEKARNAVDMSNAQALANGVEYYFMTNSEALAELTLQCNTIKQHCVSIAVSATTTAVNPVLQKAAKATGLIKTIDSRNYTKDILCSSQEKWIGYQIIVTNYSKSTYNPTGDLRVYFWGIPVNGKVFTLSSLAVYEDPVLTKDTTGFKSLMGR